VRGGTVKGILRLNVELDVLERDGIADLPLCEPL
jgi:hypothetical protein